MAAGIIDHETGTRDIRRLSGLYRFMPITATLAMVAAAAMAGVPLLNGFLSKEMFFAEARRESSDRRSRPRAALHRHAREHVQRRLFAALHPRRVLRACPDGPAAHAARAAALDALSGRASGARLRGRRHDSRRSPSGRSSHRRCARCSAPDTPAYSLALWHGFTLPLLMSVIALVGGVILYRALQTYLARGADGAPFCRRFKGRRIFEQRARHRFVAMGAGARAPARHAAPAAATALARGIGAARRAMAALQPGPQPARCRESPFDPAFMLRVGRRRRMRASARPGRRNFTGWPRSCSSAAPDWSPA